MKRFLAIASCLALTGCVSAAINSQNPTASEMLLRAHAGERASAGVNLHIPVGTKTFVQVQAGSGLPGGEYAVAAFRAHLAGRGVALMDDVKQADTIVELRIASAGIDDVDRVLGLAATTIPGIPGTSFSTAVTIPEVALYSKHTRTGVVEMSAIARDAHTGRLTSAVGPVWGISEIVNRHLLLGLVSGQEQEAPGLHTVSGH